jgi:acyl-CoA thioesterase II
MSPGDLFVVRPGETSTRWHWTPPSALLTPRGFLQGGGGLGAAITALERTTGRPLVWANAQFVSFAMGEARLDLSTNVVAEGRLSSQARCVVARDGVELLAVQASLGARHFPHHGTWVQRPDVPPPDDCPSFLPFAPGGGDLGDLVELRLARGRLRATLDGCPGDGALALWVRFTDGSEELSAARLSVIGDFAPLVFGNALGVPAYGNSLDNTIRMGPVERGSWVVLDIQALHVHDGIGHAHAMLWGATGTLLAEVSQSAIVRLEPTSGSAAQST